MVTFNCGKKTVSYFYEVITMFEFESTIVVDDNIEFTLVKKTKVDRWDGCYPIEETITDVIGKPPIKLDNIFPTPCAFNSVFPSE